LGCSSASQHKARYASIFDKKSDSVYKPSSKVNYEKLEKLNKELKEEIEALEQERQQMAYDLHAGQCDCCRSWTINRACYTCDHEYQRLVLHR